MIYDCMVLVGLSAICYAALLISPVAFWLTIGSIFVILGIGGYWGKSRIKK